MASTSGLSRRRAVPSAASASSPPAAGGTSSLSALSSSQGQGRPSSPAAIPTANAGHKIAYDERDLGDVEEDRINPRLTLMEEVLLLGLKDKQASPPASLPSSRALSAKSGQRPRPFVRPSPEPAPRPARRAVQLRSQARFVALQEHPARPSHTSTLPQCKDTR